MDFQAFSELAHAAWTEIPDAFRRGIDGLEVSPERVPHPRIPQVFTLGECRTDEYPSEYGGIGEVRSRVVLYHGSFAALSRLDPEFDWEDEVWETLTHEVRHHLEWLAGEDALEVVDEVEDHNFARREGGAFDPFFFRLGTRVGPAAWEVDGDVFLEVPLDGSPEQPLRLRWGGRRYQVPVPEPLGDVHFLCLDETERGGELLAVLVRRRGVADWLRSAFLHRPLDVHQSDAPW